MQHHFIVSGYRRVGSRLRDNTVPVVAGLFIMISGVCGGIWGCTLVADSHFDKSLIAAAMSLIGGLYMALTGLWFITRNGINKRRVMGLTVMVAGILLGTCLGMLIIARDETGQFTGANAVFFGGLLVHFLGVLYVRKE